MTAGVRKIRVNDAPLYRDNFDHLGDELLKLDLLIKRRVLQFRMYLRAMQKAASSHPMYISHDEVDLLLTQSDPPAVHSAELKEIDRELELLQKRCNAVSAESAGRGVFLALPQLAYFFGLSPFELQTVVICLAPELDRKYDKLYAYLQDDITRKKPSIDLVLDLLCRTESERWHARTLFSVPSPLFRLGILQKCDDSQSPSGSSGLSQFLKLDPHILSYLLGNNAIDNRLTNYIKYLPPQSSLGDVHVDPSIKKQLLQFSRQHFSKENPLHKKLIFHFQGPYGVGKKDLAQGICGELSCPLLVLDMELLPLDDSCRDEIIELTFREGLLHQAAVFLANADIALKEEGRGGTLLKKLAQVSAECGWLTFLAGEKPLSHRGIFEGAIFQEIELPVPEVPVRKSAWENALKQLGSMPDAAWANQLASQFRMTPGQIREAAELTGIHHDCVNPQQSLTLSDLFRACRIQSNQKLSELALKIEPRYDWEDLVLPENNLSQLKEICSQVKHRYRVFGDWGFGQKLSHGKGLSVLFSGPSGTGKTMGAEVISHELRLDLYKIDLSGVVSKYIGETEKNLARVFQEAETSNAVLFFDEADALFGKRTEVSDAHDRYANIETSYLLQKMEEYEGVVILATNLRDNMDEAFTRRIRFIVEFPFPDEASRSRIWRKHFPKESPVSDQVDYDFLAKKFQIAGGNIKNIVLNAAFLAAENGGIIGMEQLLHGTKREFEKMGKLWTEKNLYKSSGQQG